MHTFLPLIILNGRPAAGKSEVIDYLTHLPDDTRRDRLHIGNLHEIDDFPMLWTWFEEDAILEQQFNHPRLHTDADGYFISEDLWHLLIVRLGLEYQKLLRDNPDLHKTHTVLIEFARGTEHGGYRKAYSYLSENILRQAGIFYIDVSFEESLRKNRRRFNPDRPDSILEHGLSDAKLARLYRDIDWYDIVNLNADEVMIQNVPVPYAVFENHDDVTTSRGAEFEARMEAVCNLLWARWKRVHAGT